MATSLSAAFTAIANAIRAKKGVSTTYTPDEMPDAIASIATATLQTKTQTVTPSANWSGTNTNNATITPDSGYDGMSQVNVNVPMLRDYTLMTADTVETPGTVYNGNTSQSNSQQLLRMHPTKDGMSYTGSYLFLKPNSYLGNATASDVVSGKTFSSSNGIQLTGTGSGGSSGYTIEDLNTWEPRARGGWSSEKAPTATLYDYFKITFQRSTTDTLKYELIIPIFNDIEGKYSSNYRTFGAGIFRNGDTGTGSDSTYAFRWVYATSRPSSVYPSQLLYTFGMGPCQQFRSSLPATYIQEQQSWLVPIKWQGIILT